LLATLAIQRVQLKILLSPKEGWPDFSSSKELIELLWDSLPRSSWEYYNFTSDSSIWASGENTVIANFSGEECLTFEKLEFNIDGSCGSARELHLLISKLQCYFGVVSTLS
jgi:hypothetical protein